MGNLGLLDLFLYLYCLILFFAFMLFSIRHMSLLFACSFFLPKYKQINSVLVINKNYAFY